MVWLWESCHGVLPAAWPVLLPVLLGAVGLWIFCSRTFSRVPERATTAIDFTHGKDEPVVASKGHQAAHTSRQGTLESDASRHALREVHDTGTDAHQLATALAALVELGFAEAPGGSSAGPQPASALQTGGAEALAVALRRLTHVLEQQHGLQQRLHKQQQPDAKQQVAVAEDAVPQFTVTQGVSAQPLPLTAAPVAATHGGVQPEQRDQVQCLGANEATAKALGAASLQASWLLVQLASGELPARQALAQHIPAGVITAFMCAAAPDVLAPEGPGPSQRAAAGSGPPAAASNSNTATRGSLSGEVGKGSQRDSGDTNGDGSGSGSHGCGGTRSRQRRSTSGGGPGARLLSSFSAMGRGGSNRQHQDPASGAGPAATSALAAHGAAAPPLLPQAAADAILRNCSWCLFLLCDAGWGSGQPERPEPGTPAELRLARQVGLQLLPPEAEHADTGAQDRPADVLVRLVESWDGEEAVVTAAGVLASLALLGAEDSRLSEDAKELLLSFPTLGLLCEVLCDVGGAPPPPAPPIAQQLQYTNVPHQYQHQHHYYHQGQQQQHTPTGSVLLARPLAVLCSLLQAVLCSPPTAAFLLRQLVSEHAVGLLLHSNALPLPLRRQLVRQLLGEQEGLQALLAPPPPPPPVAPAMTVSAAAAAAGAAASVATVARKKRKAAEKYPEASVLLMPWLQCGGPAAAGGCSERKSDGGSGGGATVGPLQADALDAPLALCHIISAPSACHSLLHPDCAGVVMAAAPFGLAPAGAAAAAPAAPGGAILAGAPHDAQPQQPQQQQGQPEAPGAAAGPPRVSERLGDRERPVSTLALAGRMLLAGGRLDSVVGAFFRDLRAAASAVSCHRRPIAARRTAGDPAPGPGHGQAQKQVQGGDAGVGNTGRPAMEDLASESSGAPSDMAEDRAQREGLGAASSPGVGSGLAVAACVRTRGPRPARRAPPARSATTGSAAMLASSRCAADVEGAAQCLGRTRPDSSMGSTAVLPLPGLASCAAISRQHSVPSAQRSSAGQDSRHECQLPSPPNISLLGSIRGSGVHDPAPCESSSRSSGSGTVFGTDTACLLTDVVAGVAALIDCMVWRSAALAAFKCKRGEGVDHTGSMSGSSTTVLPLLAAARTSASPSNGTSPSPPHTGLLHASSSGNASLPAPRRRSLERELPQGSDRGGREHVPSVSNWALLGPARPGRAGDPHVRHSKRVNVTGLPLSQGSTGAVSGAQALDVLDLMANWEIGVDESTGAVGARAASQRRESEDVLATLSELPLAVPGSGPTRMVDVRQEGEQPAAEADASSETFGFATPAPASSAAPAAAEGAAGAAAPSGMPAWVTAGAARPATGRGQPGDGASAPSVARLGETPVPAAVDPEISAYLDVPDSPFVAVKRRTGTAGTARQPLANGGDCGRPFAAPYSAGARGGAPRAPDHAVGPSRAPAAAQQVHEAGPSTSSPPTMLGSPGPTPVRQPASTGSCAPEGAGALHAQGTSAAANTNQTLLAARTAAGLDPLGGPGISSLQPSGSSGALPPYTFFGSATLTAAALAVPVDVAALANRYLGPGGGSSGSCGYSAAISLASAAAAAAAAAAAGVSCAPSYRTTMLPGAAAAVAGPPGVATAASRPAAAVPATATAAGVPAAAGKLSPSGDSACSHQGLNATTASMLQQHQRLGPGGGGGLTQLPASVRSTLQLLQDSDGESSDDDHYHDLAHVVSDQNTDTAAYGSRERAGADATPAVQEPAAAAGCLQQDLEPERVLGGAWPHGPRVAPARPHSRLDQEKSGSGGTEEHQRQHSWWPMHLQQQQPHGRDAGARLHESDMCEWDSELFCSPFVTAFCAAAPADNESEQGLGLEAEASSFPERSRLPSLQLVASLDSPALSTVAAARHGRQQQRERQGLFQQHAAVRPVAVDEQRSTSGAGALSRIDAAAAAAVSHRAPRPFPALQGRAHPASAADLTLTGRSGGGSGLSGWLRSIVPTAGGGPSPAATAWHAVRLSDPLLPVAAAPVACPNPASAAGGPHAGNGKDRSLPAAPMAVSEARVDAESPNQARPGALAHACAPAVAPAAAAAAAPDLTASGAGNRHAFWSSTTRTDGCFGLDAGPPSGQLPSEAGSSQAFSGSTTPRLAVQEDRSQGLGHGQQLAGELVGGADSAREGGVFGVVSMPELCTLEGATQGPGGHRAGLGRGSNDGGGGAAAAPPQQLAAHAGEAHAGESIITAVPRLLPGAVREGRATGASGAGAVGAVFAFGEHQVSVSVASFRALRHASPLLRAWLVRFPDPSRPITILKFPGLGDAANARVLRHMAQWALEAREQEKKKQLHSQQQQQLLLPGGLPSRGPTPGGLAPSSTRLDTAGGLSTTAAGGAKSATMVSGSRLVIPAAGVPAAAGAPAAAAAEEEDTELRRIVDVEELAHLWSTADYLQMDRLLTAVEDEMARRFTLPPPDGAAAWRAAIALAAAQRHTGAASRLLNLCAVHLMRGVWRLLEDDEGIAAVGAAAAVLEPAVTAEVRDRLVALVALADEDLSG